MVKVAPSILAADKNNLEEEIQKVIEAGADYIHIDVMDGKFVDNITPGIEMLKTARKVASITLDVHLMVEHPEEYINKFLDANIITFHLEAVDEITANEIIAKLKKEKIKIGISIKPETPVEKILPYLEKIDMVLVMTVEPGSGGQKMIESTLDKISKIREKNSKIDIEVDGGINEETASKAKIAGANILVAGTAIFCNDDPEKIIKELKQ